MKPSLPVRFSALLVLLTTLTTSCSKATDTVSPAPASDTSSGADTKLNVTVATVAGKEGDRGNAEDGNGAAARFWNPTKMVFDPRNQLLYVADGTTIRSVDQQNNVKTYMPLSAASRFSEVLDLALAPGSEGGSLYFTTKENDLCLIQPNGASFRLTKIIDRIYGGNETGPLNSGDQLDGANGVASGKNGAIYFFNSYWNTMRRITFTSTAPFTGSVEPFAGKPLQSRSGDAWPFADGGGNGAGFGGSVPDIAADEKGNVYVADFRNDLVRLVTPDGRVSSLFQYKGGWGVDKDGPVSLAQANRVTQVAVTGNGAVVFFTTYGRGGNNLPALRMVRPGNEVVTLVGEGRSYGDGAGNEAGLGTVGGLAVTPDGKTIYVAEPGKKVIRKVTVQ